MIEKAIQKADQDNLKSFVDTLASAQVLKSILNQDKNSFFLIRKIQSSLTKPEDQELLKRIIQDNIN